MSEVRIPFALCLDNDRMVAVDDVPRGLACNCICPGCGARVEACKGEQMQYFRHEKTSQGDGNNCVNSYETSMHSAAKQVFESCMEIWIPEQVFDPGKNLPREVVVPERFYAITKVEAEATEGNVRPDIVLYSGAERLYCEIFVTHAVDDEKKRKLYEKNCQTIEIDLSDFYDRKRQPNLEELRERLLGKNEKKKWVFDSRQLVDKRIKYQKVKVLYGRWIEREGKYRIEGCPQNISETGRVSMEDCGHCPYCATINNDTEIKEITCTAYAGFSLQDPSIDMDRTIQYIEAVRRKRTEERKDCGSISAPVRSDISALPKECPLETGNIEQCLRPEDLNRFETGEAKAEPIIRDRYNRRVVKCVICGKLGVDSDFSSYGGSNDGVNYGVHSKQVNVNCDAEYNRLQNAAREETRQRMKSIQQQDMKCPVCGSSMKLRTGSYGKFWGCSRYPGCRGTRKYCKKDQGIDLAVNSCNTPINRRKKGKNIV